MHRYGSATAATEHMHRDGESNPYCALLRRTDGNNRACSATASRTYYASLRRSNVSDRPSIATARAGQTMQGYNGAMVAMTGMHRDGESTADYASLRRSYGRDISCTRDGESSADYACYAGPTRTRTPATGIRVAHTEHHRHTLHPLRAARGEARTPNNFRGDVTVRTTHAVGMTVTGPAVRRQCL